MLLYFVNSKTAYLNNSIAIVLKMHDQPSDSVLEPWQKEDAARLLTLFKAYRKNGGLPQKVFATTYGLKSQGNMGHYLHGRQPLNIEQANNFSIGLGVPVSDFSPVLAVKMEGISDSILNSSGVVRLSSKPAAWPLSDELLRRLLNESSDSLRKIENGLRGQLDMPLLAPQQRLANGA